MNPKLDRFDAAAWVLGLLMLGLMIGSGLHKGLAYDEPNNLHYGYQLWTQGPSVVPDGQRMPVLALHAAGCLPFHCDFEVLQNSEWARLAVRWPSMLFALLTGWLIYRWASLLYGKAAGLGSLLLYVLNPNFIAHGKELTSDSATAFFVLASVFSFWRFTQRQKGKDLVFCALMTGAAIVSKYSALILLPVLAALYLIVVTQNRVFAPKRLRSALINFLFFGMIIWLVINSAYLFSGSFTKASDYAWQSRSYQKWGKSPVPIPLPKVFVLGMDTTRYLEENPHLGRGNNYILGKLHRKGRWFSFPVMVLLKTPLAFFILIWLAFSRPPGKFPEIAWFTWLPFSVWMFIFSIFCHAQLGIRYVLPALSFPIIFSARVFAKPLSQKRLRTLTVLLGWYAVSSLSYYPHMISYFNEAIGPRVNAYKYLSDSNLDWEDKKYFIDRFKARHPEMSVEVEPLKPVPGYLIVGANELTGVMDEERYKWLRENFTPLKEITYSHYLFYVPPETQQFQHARGTLTVPSSQEEKLRQVLGAGQGRS